MSLMDDWEAGWVTIPGYGGVYQVSEGGQVRRIRGGRTGLLHPSAKTPSKGSRFRCVKLTDTDGSRRQVKVARLVAEAFLGPVPNGYSTVHRNGDVLDDSAGNLIYLSKASVGSRYGYRASARGVIKVSPAAEVVGCYHSSREAGRENHMSYQTVADRCNGRVKSFLAPDGYRYLWDDSPEGSAIWEACVMDGYVEGAEAERYLAAYEEVAL